MRRMRVLIVFIVAAGLIASAACHEAYGARGLSKSGSKFVSRIGKKQGSLRRMAQNKKKLQKMSMKRMSLSGKKLRKRR